jgi:hypothetical protein
MHNGKARSVSLSCLFYETVQCILIIFNTGGGGVTLKVVSQNQTVQFFSKTAQHTENWYMTEV